jgi:TolA-binding protein
MMKPGCLLLCLAVFSGAICAEQTEPCAGLEGPGLTQCRSNEQTLRQEERLEKLLQQQQERQNQLDQQQREVQQQLESMRLQNESLRKQLERDRANQPAQAVATESSKKQDAQNARDWKAENPWYGSDYPRTQFASRYIKQLQKDRPDLAGRELLDAVSLKVNETFGLKH